MNRFMGKMSAGVGYTVQGMKNASSNCKIDGKICSMGKDINELTAEIGRLTVKSLDEKRDLGPEIMERYDAICAARDKIKEAEKDRVSRKIVCPSCGKKTMSGMAYCGYCGASLETACECA